MKYLFFFTCILIIACQPSNLAFVERVDTALEIIIPQYNDYVLQDTRLSAEQITIIRDSVKELAEMVKEELARLRGQ